MGEGNELVRLFLWHRPGGYASKEAMPQFSLEKSIEIDAPIEQVFACVRGFKQWGT